VIGKLKIRASSLVVICCLSAALAGLGAALWFSLAPRDYEECFEDAQERKLTSEERAFVITQCGVSFAGRRKADGAYSYYDFMQNRSFDIAGPNPSPEEQKRIDREYLAYLAAERRSAIAAALAKQQNEQILADLEREQQLNASTANVGPPMEITPRNLKAVTVPKPIDRSKITNCNDDSLSCTWSKFSAKLKDAFDSTSKTRR
jgi:hypothetical protein